jgi:hypothetical protein
MPLLVNCVSLRLAAAAISAPVLICAPAPKMMPLALIT